MRKSTQNLQFLETKHSIFKNVSPDFNGRESFTILTGTSNFFAYVSKLTITFPFHVIRIVRGTQETGVPG